MLLVVRSFSGGRVFRGCLPGVKKTEHPMGCSEKLIVLSSALNASCISFLPAVQLVLFYQLFMAFKEDFRTVGKIIAHAK